MPNVIDILRERQFIEAVTSEEIRSHCEKPVKVYAGFDPTADSLHLGSLVGIICLGWFQRCGHTPIALVGGATGMIGDPSGRSSERQLLTSETINLNLAGIRKNLESILKQGPIPPVLVNNYDWFEKMTFIDFLRDVGKSFRLGPMLAKESVKKRFETEEGLSFTEFSYQMLQAYDFYYLNQKNEVTIQIGGSDQWGNITAGTEYIRKEKGTSVFGLTHPLLVKSDGQKFGKSEKGAIWLSPEKLSPYEFYQHLIRTSDADVIQLLRMLTYLEMSEIREIEKGMQESSYVPNSAQKRLAQEVTKIVHGQEALEIALKVTAAAAPGSETLLDVETLEQVAKDMPSVHLQKSDVVEQKLIDILPKIGLLSSKSEARRLIKNGGVYLNNKKIEGEETILGDKDLIEGKLLLLAVGKKNKMLVKINE